MSFVRTRRFARIDLNAFNKTPNYPIPGTSEYYEKTLDDPNINLLTFDPDGPTYKFNYSDFEEIETIASSRHVVKKFLHNPSGRHLAIKFVHIPHNRHATDEENVKKLKYLVREIDNFRALKKEGNLVKFYGFCLHESQALICMELMDLSLKELILRFQEMTISFPEDLLGRVIVGIIKALDACKTHKIMHREVKPENILINKEGQIKLRDFGESRILHDSLASTFVGKCSIAYWPPERFENEKSKFDLKADIWSFGITLIEAVAGQVPYKDRKGNVPNNIILLQNLILNLDTSQTVEDTFVGYSENLKNFVKTCLNRVETRPEYGDLMMTEVYKKYDVANSDIYVKNLLKKEFFEEGEELDENVMRIFKSIELILDEILKFEKMEILKIKFEEMFQLFYELEVSGYSQDSTVISKFQEFKGKIFEVAEKLEFFIAYFMDSLSKINVQQKELELLDICQTYNGIKCFLKTFKDCFLENEDMKMLIQENNFIEELDKKIKNLKLSSYEPVKDQVEEMDVEVTNRHSKGWWIF